ncbi:copper resistance CopC domain protein [Mycobacterium xenopi 4042]|uniref:Copper resistance CopC domain protein n=1 Tax=Mycobacterium xenopi 4042 TaxID=1299334 RepID=X8CMX2_MYCXE|nr:copper resistance CopC domain protein [Mycobacterium xenopi 4042]
MNYRVTSADGHVVSGSWSFRLAVPGTGEPGPAAYPGTGPRERSRLGRLRSAPSCSLPVRRCGLCCAADHEVQSAWLPAVFGHRCWHDGVSTAGVRDWRTRRKSAKEQPHGRPAGSPRRRTRRGTDPAHTASRGGRTGGRPEAPADQTPRLSRRRPEATTEGGEEDRRQESARQGRERREEGPKTAAKKAPAKKSPARKPPAKKAAPAKVEPPASARVETNGQLADGAKQAAAQAKSTVETADYPVPRRPRCRRLPAPGAGGGRGRPRPDRAAADPTAAAPLNRWP